MGDSGEQKATFSAGCKIDETTTKVDELSMATTSGDKTVRKRQKTVSHSTFFNLIFFN